MSFLSVIKSKDINSLGGSGLIGLSPVQADEDDISHPFTHGVPGFIAQLKNNKKFTD